MTIIAGTSLLSGLTVQQKYSVSETTDTRTNRNRARPSVSPSGDTVQISSEAWELFRAQTAGGGAGIHTPPDNAAQAAGTVNSPNTAAERFEARITVEDQIDQLESEISSLKADIAALAEKAMVDDMAAALLRSKQARLQALQAKLTGLLARSMWTL